MHLQDIYFAQPEFFGDEIRYVSGTRSMGVNSVQKKWPADILGPIPRAPPNIDRAGTRRVQPLYGVWRVLYTPAG